LWLRPRRAMAGSITHRSASLGTFEWMLADELWLHVSQATQGTIADHFIWECIVARRPGVEQAMDQILSELPRLGRTVEFRDVYPVVDRLREHFCSETQVRAMCDGILHEAARQRAFHLRATVQSANYCLGGARLQLPTRTIRVCNAITGIVEEEVRVPPSARASVLRAQLERKPFTFHTVKLLSGTMVLHDTDPLPSEVMIVKVPFPPKAVEGVEMAVTHTLLLHDQDDLNRDDPNGVDSRDDAHFDTVFEEPCRLLRAAVLALEGMTVMSQDCIGLLQCLKRNHVLVAMECSPLFHTAIMSLTSFLVRATGPEASGSQNMHKLADCVAALERRLLTVRTD